MNFFSSKFIRLFKENIEKLYFILSILIIITTNYAISLVVSSPLDYLQKESVKIMYIHVPAAWLGLSLYSIIGIANLIYIYNKNLLMVLFSKAIAPVGLLFTLLALASGSIWGRLTWGSWWEWDARLTSTLALFFVYLSYIIIINIFEENEKKYMIASYFASLGLINIPIIKYSVDFWYTLHQPSSFFTKKAIASIDPVMLKTLFWMFITLSLWSLLMILLNCYALILRKKLQRYDIF